MLHASVYRALCLVLRFRFVAATVLLLPADLLLCVCELSPVAFLIDSFSDEPRGGGGGEVECLAQDCCRLCGELLRA